MQTNDEETQVFIVRLWSELREIEGARPLLRGTVEHVPGGERLYIKELEEVKQFILPYLKQLGVEAPG